jgi:hypothetical protein
MRDQHWLTDFTSEADLAAVTGSTKSIVNKIGLIGKQRPDGSMKWRLIWDLLRSQVNARAHQGERIVLPRILDFINDALDLQRDSKPD